MARAFRSTVFRLVLFYLLTLALMLAIVPWTQAGTDESPFVKVMAATARAGRGRRDQLRDPGRGAVGDEQPALHHHAHDVQPVAGRLRAGALRALERAWRADRRAVCCRPSALRLPRSLTAFWPAMAFGLMMSLAIFGAMFAWLMIFVTHLFFRARYDGPAPSFRMVLHPFGSLARRGFDGGYHDHHRVHERIPHDARLRPRIHGRSRRHLPALV